VAQTGGSVSSGELAAIVAYAAAFGALAAFLYRRDRKEA
jgi:ABC-2 type transport system permease protein